jgi:hypothetical protein
MARKTKTPAPTPEEALARYALMDKAIRGSGFQIDELESALGMYMIGFHFGWKVLYLVHSKRTIKKYEALLGIKVTETFPEIGPDADRTNAHKIIETVSNFWKVVSGDEKPSLKIDKRSMSD